MRLVQITDLHIGLPQQDTYGVDVRNNFSRTLAALEKIDFDHLIITGDLCYSEGNIEIYKWIKTLLDASGFDYYLLNGNHDRAELMATVFGERAPLTNGELYYQVGLSGQRCFMLDSGPGVVSQAQLNWLKDEIKDETGPLNVFMHHPPAYVGIPFMDKNHALKNIDEVQAILTEYPNRVFIFSGHYHGEKVVHENNLSMHVTPSLFFQIDQEAPEFKVDHYRIAYRTIDLDDQSMRTALVYLDK